MPTPEKNGKMFYVFDMLPEELHRLKGRHSLLAHDVRMQEHQVLNGTQNRDADSVHQRLH